MYARCLKLLFLIALSVFLPFGGAFASSTPVKITHTVTSYVERGTVATLYVSIRVENPGRSPLSNLTLAFVHLPPFIEGPDLQIGTLGPHGIYERSIELEAPVAPDRGELLAHPLFFAGSCYEETGGAVEFAATSSPGGAK